MAVAPYAAPGPPPGRGVASAPLPLGGAAGGAPERGAPTRRAEGILHPSPNSQDIDGVFVRGALPVPRLVPPGRGWLWGRER